MNEEVLNQNGLDEGLAEYIRSNIPVSESEVIEETNEEVEIEEEPVEEIIGDVTEEVAEPSVDDIEFTDVTDDIEILDL